MDEVKQFFLSKVENKGDLTTADEELLDVEVAKFRAAEKSGDGLLDIHEFKWFYFPEIHPEVLKASAQGHFKMYDENKDGKIVMTEFWRDEEIPERIKKDFVSLDMNKDGSIAYREWRRSEGGQIIGEFEDLIDFMDKNKDGLMTAEEMEDNQTALYNNDRTRRWMERAEL